MADAYWQKVMEGFSSERPKGPDKKCSYYPCHFLGQDCTLCYCPFYPCHDERLGWTLIGKKGNAVWDCKDCYWAHRPAVAREAFAYISRVKDEPQIDSLLDIRNKILLDHPVKARSIMVLGTSSGAGKSLTCMALCRILSNMGLDVAPFKSQNMSLNSCVTVDGKEMARAQWLQAIAARAEPDVSMNPILLKPKKDDVSQVIVEGRPLRDMSVAEYYGSFVRNEGLDIARRNYEKLARTHDVVVIEGAGSPAEINLGDGDIANMATATIANASCVLVANIDRGGAFAYICGTLDLLSKEHKNMFKGIIINNMSGDPSSLANGIIEIEERSGIPVLGVVPHIDHALPDEDSQDLRSRTSGRTGCMVAVIKLPHISNFTDLDALQLEQDILVKFVDRPEQLLDAAGIIIPGTKNTVEDLLWLRSHGLDTAICSMQGTVPIVGICGGYQMLGDDLDDMKGLEGGSVRVLRGLGLLRCITKFDSYEKRTIQVSGKIISTGEEVRGYEIHMGRTTSRETSLISINDENNEHLEGAISPDGMVMGTYIHGLFDLPAFRRLFISKVRKTVITNAPVDYNAYIEKDIENVAATFRTNLDIDHIIKTIRG